jgi:ATP-binding protein involved in chromosome partitioning
MNIEQAEIHALLARYKFPYYQQDCVSAMLVEAIDILPEAIVIRFVLGFPAAGISVQVRNELQNLLADSLGARQLQLDFRLAIKSHAVQTGLQGIAGVKNIIAIASGKGGVGKSTTTVNLALALQQEGARVGILDADIYGPSQPHLLGVNSRPESHDGKILEPIRQYGLQSMSIGYLVDEQSAMVWRGPMATRALQQLLHDTNWQDVDYLLIDLPPGTGDIQLTLAQKIPVSGALVVTTPQELALLDVRRAIEMFAKVNVPVLGIIENMAMYTCSACNHQEAIFGTEGAAQLAQQYAVPVLGSLPLAKAIRAQADLGEPIMITDKDGTIAEAYRDVARRATAALAQKQRDYSKRFPKIVVES